VFLPSARKLASVRNTPAIYRTNVALTYASPYLEFLDKLQHTARRMPQAYEFHPQHADGIRYVDLIEGERVLNEVIYECQRSLEEIGHAKLDLEARSRGRERG
jgi:hypothetical protein